MNFRVARHTSNLNEIVDFYSSILELDILGTFENHSNYNGVFMGHKKCNWHLEFTSSFESPKHISDDDDLLVFYCDSLEEYNRLIDNFSKRDLRPIQSKNPYWNDNGKTYKDPDGFLIVLALPK